MLPEDKIQSGVRKARKASAGNGILQIKTNCYLSDASPGIAFPLLFPNSPHVDASTCLSASWNIPNTPHAVKIFFVPTVPSFMV